MGDGVPTAVQVVGNLLQPGKEAYLRSVARRGQEFAVRFISPTARRMYWVSQLLGSRVGLQVIPVPSL